MERIILHLDMDAFFAQIEKRENPQFKGMPIVVGADPKEGRGRGVVSSASYRARKFGIKSAMPISKAYQLCPKAIFLPVNMELYQKVSENIMTIVKKYSPTWEIASLDEAYLDVSFLKSYKGAKLLAEKLKAEILEKEKLTCTVGIGPNKLIAKIASKRGKPNGILIIQPNQALEFLEPLDIEKLPGIGPKTADVLRGVGVKTIKELKNLSRVGLQGMFGKVGESIYQKARGEDEAEVNPEEIIKSIGKEHTFEKDTRDPKIIFEKFEEILKAVSGELFSAGFSFKTATVVCRFEGFETHTKSKTLKEKSQKFEVLEKEAKRLLLKFLVENPKLIRLIGLRVAIVQPS